MEIVNQSKDLSGGFQPRADRSKLESPLEELFIHALEKYLSPQSDILPQYEVITLAGKFRLDFLVTAGNKKIAFECDGKDFHDQWRDEWRDALILGTGEIDTIYRFRGKDLFTFIDDCIYLIYQYDKILFNDRYPQIAQQLISDDLKNHLQNFYYTESNLIGYKIINEDGKHIGWLELRMERRNKDDRAGFWNSLFKVAQKNLGKSIEQLIEIQKKERNTSSNH